jgi:hypothetical protein
MLFGHKMFVFKDDIFPSEMKAVAMDSNLQSKKFLLKDKGEI